MSASELPELPFRHENRSGGPANLALLVALLAVCVGAILTGQGILLLVVGGTCLAGLLYFKHFNPRAGIEIDDGSVTFWRGRKREAVPLAGIDHVALGEAGGRIGATIHRHDGGQLDIHRSCLPEPAALAGVLSRAGVRVTGI